MAFDGVAAKVSLPSTLDITALPFTLEAWVRPANYSGWHVIFSKRNSHSQSGMRFDVGLVQSNGRVYVTTGGGTVRSTYAPPLNQWTHLAVVATTTGTQLYVNGALQQTLGSITLGTASGAAVNIGRTGDNDDPFAGAIDDLRLYKRALSLAEIQFDMATPVQVPGPHLTITQPASGATIPGSTVTVGYLTSGDLSEVDHAHFQLDSNPEVMDLTLDGIYQFANVPSGSHTLVGRLVRADHSAIPGTDASVAFSTTAPDTIPPTAPSNLVGSANGAQVSLSWTAATDNVGVTRYRVERCQGVGCSVFAEIGTSTTTSYVDSGLLATTSYTYRVRATDAALLMGPYTGEVSVTTGSVTLIGLLAAYGFDEGTGSATLDGSGRGNSGTLTGGATWATGRSGSAVAFNGNTAKVALPTSLDIATLPFTIEAWVNPSDYSDWHVIFSKRTSYSAAGMRLDVGLAPTTGRIYLAGGGTSLTSTTAPPLNTWTHVAVVADVSGTRLYIGGELRETLSAVTLGNAAGAAVNLGITGDNQDAFAGLIDEFRLYTRALTTSEIQVDMNTPVNAPTGPTDTTPPTVSLTAPAPGATLNGVTSLTAIASDNVGVAGVRFVLDGANLGDEVFNPPFTLAWDSGTAAPGQHTLAALARDFSNNTTTSAAVTVTVVSTADSMGAWSSVMNWPIVAAHAALLPTGDVLAVSNYSEDGGVQLWRPSTNTFTPKPYSAINLFCMAHTFLADGRLFTAGGTIGTDDDIGPHESTIFDPVSGTWSAAALMAVGRYYPTTTTLGDGRVLVQGGTKTCASCIADIPENLQSGHQHVDRARIECPDGLQVLSAPISPARRSRRCNVAR